MNIEEYKKEKKQRKSNLISNAKTKKFVFNFLNQILITTIIFLSALIIAKTNDQAKDIIYKYVYQSDLPFTKIKKLYEKYLGSVLPIGNIINNNQEVFNEKLSYTAANLYLDGVELVVSNNYLVPVLESGIVVFIGEKEEYGKTVIVQQIDGVNVWYGNININTIKLYDYVEKGKLLGEVISNKLYLVYQKEGKFLDYKEYL